MLVLSRRSGEQIFVGEEIEVTILEIRGNQVKLGFNAPRYVSISRGEIHHGPASSLAAGVTAEARYISAAAE